MNRPVANDEFGFNPPSPSVKDIFLKFKPKNKHLNKTFVKGTTFTRTLKIQKGTF